MNVVDVTAENFQQVMFEESKQRLVLLDFWADWCAPCKALGPILERLAEQYGGQFLLAKINADEQQAITAQFGVRSLPTVAFVKDGQPIDAFQGLEPEAAIRERLDKHLPAVWQKNVDEAQRLMSEGQFDQALPLLLEAYALSENDISVGFVMADCYLHLKRVKEAQALLTNATIEYQVDPYYKELMARLELIQEAAETPAIQELQNRLNEHPEDLSVHYELAIQYNQAQRNGEALELLLAVLQKDRNFHDGMAKKAFLDILSGLPKGDPMAVRFQRKLFTLLY